MHLSITVTAHCWHPRVFFLTTGLEPQYSCRCLLYRLGPECRPYSRPYTPTPISWKQVKFPTTVALQDKHDRNETWLQNRAARIICTNFDIINYRGIDLVRELQWLSISQRINYFLCVLVFNCIHGNAPCYLSDSIAMASHMHDRNTRLNMSPDVNAPLGRTHYMRSSFIL